jgi:hypothetical protein
VGKSLSAWRRHLTKKKDCPKARGHINRLLKKNKAVKAVEICQAAELVAGKKAEQAPEEDTVAFAARVSRGIANPPAHRFLYEGASAE